MPSLNLAALAATLFTFSAAHAADEATFSYSRGELASSVTVNALYERMDRAVARACRTSGERGFYAIERDKRCRAQLLDSFVDQIDSPAINVVHERRHGAGRIARAD